jgi:hypothetical protein
VVQACGGQRGADLLPLAGVDQRVVLADEVQDPATAAAMASPSRVWAFSRTRSSSRAACQAARSTTGGRPAGAAAGSLGVVAMVSSVVSLAGQRHKTLGDIPLTDVLALLIGRLDEHLAGRATCRLSE